MIGSLKKIESLNDSQSQSQSPSSASSRNHSQMDSSSVPQQSGDNPSEPISPVSKRKEKRKVMHDETGAKPKPSKTQKKTDTPLNTRSYVWEHFTRTAEDKDKCKCNYCGKNMSCLTTSGTSNLGKHLVTCKQYKAFQDSKRQQQLEQGVEADGNASLRLVKVSEAVFREAANEMVVLAQLPLSFVEGIAFKHFCNKVKLYKPHSRRTATRDVVKMFHRRKKTLRSMFKKKKQRVSITTDIWLATATGESYMAITAHYIDEQWILRKFIIGFKNVSDHTGATISSVLLECLAEWGIEKVFTITVDNATANTNALKKFKKEFKKVGNDALIMDGKFMHMRCAAHILNLVVKEGLLEVSDNVSAIRNGVQYVRSTTQRRKQFKLRVESEKLTRGSLPMDIKTRWNATYLMLTRAIVYKTAFDKMESEDKRYNDYFLEHEQGKKRIGPPKSQDWDAIERLLRFLIIFYHSTLVVSASSVVNSHKCYNEISTIELNLMELCDSPDEELKEKAKEMKEKFDKYWEGLHQINRLLIIGSIFDPRNKMQFATHCFDQLYGRDSEKSQMLAASVENVMRQLFDEYSSAYARKLSVNVPSSQGTSKSSSHAGNGVSFDGIDRISSADGVLGYKRMDSMYKDRVNEKGLQDPSNELDIYLKEKVENPNIPLGTEFNVLSWWRMNSSKFPVLSDIAKDIFAMQVSSVASESAFSTSGRLVEPHRSCLSHYMIEVLMCTEQWIKADLSYSDKNNFTNQQILADIELLDDLQKEFEDLEETQDEENLDNFLEEID